MLSFDWGYSDVYFLSCPDRMNLVKDIYAYHYVSQGKTTVNGIDDDEEMKMTDVSDSEPAFYFKALISLLTDGR